MLERIAIIGAGNVGTAAALAIAREELAHEIVLVDVRPGWAQGIALDIQHAGPLEGFDTRLTGSEDTAALAGAELVIITAGSPRRPGMSRSDLLAANLAIQDPVLDAIVRHAPQSLILQVANPADILTWNAHVRTGWPRQRILGLSGVLDSARMAAFIAEEAGCSVRNVTAMVIGGHGDTMVPLVEYSYVNGIPIAEFLDPARIARLSERTCRAGSEILQLKREGTAHIAPGAAIAQTVDAIANDRQRILPGIAILEGEYGVSGMAMCVPCQLGRRGMEQIVTLPLTDHEQALLARSIADIRRDLQRLSALREAAPRPGPDEPAGTTHPGQPARAQAESPPR